MGWEYTNSDTALVKPNRIRFRVNRNTPDGIDITGCSTRAGAKADGYNPRIGQVISGGSSQSVDIEFQFPPKVLTDGRKGNWFEGDQTGGAEPVASFINSGPRELSLSWVYIVDSFDDHTGWNIERITRQIRTLRGYFVGARDRKGSRDGLIVTFHAWCIGGDNPITARIKGLDVKYGETMVFPPGGLSDRAFPLRTDITCDFRIWTKGMRRSQADKEAWAKAEGTLGLQDLRRLTNKEPPSWY
jgi:hypothetical protein